MTSHDLPSYAVVTPVRDEAKHFARTAESMIGQLHRPTRWVIVDDGSSDETPGIAARYAEEHDWITVISSGQRDERARGGKIVRAFNLGLAVLPNLPEVIVKLDGDLFLPPHYFAWVLETFSRVPVAGIVGGMTQLYDGRRWRPDATSQHNLSGVAKAYRRDCFEQIEGLRPSMGWDGIDEYAARARGWEVHVLSELPILHFNARGSKQRWYRARWEEGVAANFMGYRWDFMLVRVAHLMLVEPPAVLGGLAVAAGFLHARLSGGPTAGDAEARKVLRAEQRSRLGGMIHFRGTRAPVPALPGGGPAFWATARSAQQTQRAPTLQPLTRRHQPLTRSGGFG
jgi:poly-beta-1,6-N-acetyl-D-glucosamine synthase